VSAPQRQSQTAAQSLTTLESTKNVQQPDNFMMIQESGLIYKSRYFRKRRHILKTSACLIISAVAFTLLLILTAGAYGAHQVAGSVEMPVAQQNALVQKYCAVCHDDVHRNGGLSLQHFDASQVEPSLAAMMISKLKSGAMGAAGLGVPDRPTQDGFYDALMAKSAGADNWSLTRTQDPATQVGLLTASIVREMPSERHPQNPELYRLKLTCRGDTREAEMQLTWSPEPASSNRTIFVRRDERAPVTYTLEGREKMGNGAKRTDGTESTSGPENIVHQRNL